MRYILNFLRTLRYVCVSASQQTAHREKNICYAPIRGFDVIPLRWRCYHHDACAEASVHVNLISSYLSAAGIVCELRAALHTDIERMTIPQRRFSTETKFPRGSCSRLIVPARIAFMRRPATRSNLMKALL